LRKSAGAWHGKENKKDRKAHKKGQVGIKERRAPQLAVAAPFFLFDLFFFPLYALRALCVESLLYGLCAAGTAPE
jgi:hypothetical protein